MSTYYPPGPMLASGVYDDVFHGTAYCDHCHETGKTDITRTGYTLTYTCPHCGADNEQAV